jgi:osmotically-inducible protein OsmY
VAATGGNVTLTGMVPSAWTRDEAEWIALKARDVKVSPTG